MTLEALICSPAHSPHFLDDLLSRCSDRSGGTPLQSLTQHLTQRPDQQAQLNTLLNCSKFSCTQFIKYPSYINTLFNELNVNSDFSALEFTAVLAKLIHTFDGDLDKQLRRLRNVVMTRIIWRDVNRISSLEQTTSELSALARFCIQTSLDHHYLLLSELYGAPRNQQQELQDFMVLGMGKLGAQELNLSSDIDLIFCYPDTGSTDGKKSIENQAFFMKLGQKVIQSLDTKNADGFVFRVDMRLRPYGQSGALVSNFRALEEYYQTQGREWERYAMVKASIVAHTGTGLRRPELQDILRSFTFRKYIDFSVIDALRKLKELIQQEVRRRKLNDDVKLGHGGIREIEFIAQVFQLIRGGRDTELQDNRLRIIFPLLSELHCLPEETASKLLDSYTFLRNSEHAIQGFDDAQTQKLPTDEHAQSALIEALGFESWPDYIAALDTHREFVHREFDAVIGAPEDGEQAHHTASNAMIHKWQEICDQHEVAEHHYSSNTSVTEKAPQGNVQRYSALAEFADCASVKNLTANSRERLDQFMPLLLTEAEQHPHAERVVDRIIPLMRAIIRRSAYLVLLIENPQALAQLVTLVQTSQQIADQLAAFPALLDELLDSSNLYSLPEKSELDNELQRAVLRIDEADLEQQMDTLRYFKLSHALRVAACEVNGTLPLMKVSDYLTMIAEVILDYSLVLVWRMMVAKHGYPDGVERALPEFLVVGYGKLGGIEMNHGSDLDLVFIYNASAGGTTNGARELDNSTFYVRLGQKLIHIINTQTVTGRLYEVDMRLRPSGNSGLLATTLGAFEKYQSNEAWTWEHQALVRARAVTGDKVLASAFNDVREKVLKQQREHKPLVADIVDMRKKMRDHLGSKEKDTQVFNLKQDPGGIVDIEFMVQYLVLAWSYVEPSLATYTDNIRILEALAQTDRLSTHEVEQLISAYKALRTYLHRQTIEQKSNEIDSSEMQLERESVIAIWRHLFG